MTMPSDENVQYNITLEAQKALIVLAELTNKTRSFADQMNYAKNVVKEFAKESGMSFAQAKNTLAGLDKELSGTTASSVVFGSKGQEAWNKVGESGEKGAAKVTKGFDGMKIAMSIFAYDLVRTGLQAVQQFFTQTIEQARQLEASLYRLQNAERILSQEGIDVSMGGFKQGIQDIKKLLPIFSREDITQMVGALAVSTKQLGLTEEQILDLARAAAIYNVQSVENETLLQSQAKLVTALISPQAKSIGEYGISFGKVTMEAKALELGILRVGESVAKLTDAQKAQVKYAIIMEGADSNLAGINSYLETNTAKLEQNKAAWKDLQTTVGQVFLPFIPTITAAMTWLNKAITMSKLFIAIWASFMGIIPNIFRGFKSGEVTIKNLVAYAKFAFENLREQWLKALFPDIPAGASDFLKKILEKAGVGKFGDTPTAPKIFDPEDVAQNGKDYAEAVKKAEEEVTEIMKDAREKREDLARDHASKMADIQRDLGRKMADIATNLRDKLEDAQKDYGNKVADINADTDKKIAETKQDSYKKSIEAEQKYQDELKSLREKYLMDLEEALRARDARQILRLMRQYALDKEKALENRDKEREQAKAETAQKLRDLEEERKEKLAQAAKDLADKIKQAQIAAARERRDAGVAHQRALADARQAYQRQLDEQRLFLQRKLQDLAASIAKEYELTAAGRAAINALIGSGGTSTSSANSAQYTSATPVTSSTWAQSGLYGTGGMAEGGTFLATRPATINVAENRPEMITATPLGKPGKDISKVFTNGSVGGGSSGQIELGLTLSPDLEARIISQTLSETANVVLKINRSK